MKPNPLALLACIGCCAAVRFGSASADEIVCPPPISVQEILKSPVPEKWSAQITDYPHNLAGVTFFDDHPSRQASVVPTRELRSGEDDVAVWLFGSSGVPMWIGCRYHGSEVLLIRKLPVSYKECRVHFGAGLMVKKIACK